MLLLLTVLLAFFSVFMASFYCLLVHPELAKQGFEKALSMSSRIESVVQDVAQQEHGGYIILTKDKAVDLPSVVAQKPEDCTIVPSVGSPDIVAHVMHDGEDGRSDSANQEKDGEEDHPDSTDHIEHEGEEDCAGTSLVEPQSSLLASTSFVS